MPDARREERREDSMHQHVAQVWAAPLSDRGPVGLWRLGVACLDAADGSPEPARRELLASVARALLVYAAEHDPEVRAEIVKLCDRERGHGENEPETARVIAELAEDLSAPARGTRGPDPGDGSPGAGQVTAPK